MAMASLSSSPIQICTSLPQRFAPVDGGIEFTLTRVLFGDLRVSQERNDFDGLKELRV